MNTIETYILIFQLALTFTSVYIGFAISYAYSIIYRSERFEFHRKKIKKKKNLSNNIMQWEIRYHFSSAENI